MIIQSKVHAKGRGIDISTLNMTLNDHNITINGFSSPEVLGLLLGLLFTLEIYLLTLKLTLSHENNIRKWIAQSKLHGNEVLQWFLALLVHI